MNKAQKKIKIFVVDDSIISRKVVISEFENNNDFEVYEYDTPAKALVDIETKIPDFIISDLVMPGMDGFEFCHAIRRYPGDGQIPFILLSGTLDDTVRAKALQSGVTETFKKPFVKFSIFKYVSQYLDTERHAFQGSALVVDDSKLTRKIIAELLTGINVRVYEADSVASAMETIEQYPVDIIILDNFLPDGKGVEWCGELRNNEIYSTIPVLGISSDEPTALEFLEAGADDYINKNLAHLEIAARTKNLLKREILSKKLRDALNNEKALNIQKNKLLGMAAHDLRNPIGLIIGYASLISEGILEGKDKEAAIKTIHDIANHTVDLLNSMLDMSSIDSGVVELEKEDMDMAALIEERVDFMNLIGKKKNIVGTFVNEINGKGPVLVNADKKRLGQVLDNLISNAIKYSQPDRDYAVVLRKDIEGILVQVADRGVGIPVGEVAGVFDAFKKTSVKATAGEKSTGLGLAIVKKLVEQHDGKIWVESEVGKGTTFSFILPDNRNI
ncbi:MAG TPA: response regulator [Candidatus Omnitrophota bacterium]|nr:response regulator [Candidatus Omnitrophota bacterium]HPS19690.1 response regulator [Candidatus Omnitrophota bacterium]